MSENSFTYYVLALKLLAIHKQLSNYTKPIKYEPLFP